MIKVEEIKKLMECAVLTGYAAGERAVNLLFIGQPETGRSELIAVMRDYPNTFYSNDLSFKGLIDEVLPKVERGEITHILVPDFVNVVSHRQASNALIPVLNSLMAEGVRDLKFYGVSRTFSKDVMGGVLTAITKQIFDRQIIFWRNTGFMTRMLIATYSYSPTTQIEIHNYIREGKYVKRGEITKKDFLTKYKPNAIDIRIPENIAEKIQVLSQSMVEQNKHYVTRMKAKDWNINLERYGFRLHKQLRSLIKGICIYNNGSPYEGLSVSETDFNDLVSLSKFMNFNFTEI